MGVQGADQADVQVKAAPSAPAGGKYELLYPVGLPGEGPFDWLDIFLQRNPQYTETSCRAVLEWGIKSECWRRGGGGSIDRPETFDKDGSVLRLLGSLAPLQERNYVVMDLKGNLLKEDRAINLKTFDGG